MDGEGVVKSQNNKILLKHFNKLLFYFILSKIMNSLIFIARVSKFQVFKPFHELMNTQSFVTFIIQFLYEKL